jgi:hypothetical protein
MLAMSLNPSSRPPQGWQSQPPLAVQLSAYQAEATVSRALRTLGLPPTHGSVGYRWQNTGSCSLINTRATSCRTVLKGLGPAFAPAVLHPRGETVELPDLTAHLLVPACQPLWHGSRHDASPAAHIRWPSPSTLAPDQPEACSHHRPSRVGCPLIRRRLRGPRRIASRGYPRRTAR